MILQEISYFFKHGQSEKVRELTLRGMAEGVMPSDIVNVLTSYMTELGIKFKNNEIFVPEVLIVARAFNAAIEVLEPIMEPSKVYTRGTVIIGTVEGDLHDIGKNLVKMMLKGNGFHVVDLGVDVKPESYNFV